MLFFAITSVTYISQARDFLLAIQPDHSVVVDHQDPHTGQLLRRWQAPNMRCALGACRACAEISPTRRRQ